MNILPTGPDNSHDPNWDRYFADLRRWNFDVAYNAFYAFPMRDVMGRFADGYRSFAARAKQEGLPCCVQIQSVVANLEDIPLTETQRYADNEYYLYEHFEGQGKKFHFASFASRAWLDFLKNLTAVFRDFGFEWVVYEEPMLHSDIPGTEDPFHALYRRHYPELKYPTHQEEGREYATLQRLKRDTLVGFYRELAVHAKSLGFEKVGIMPWFFTPTLENTPAETWNTCCDTGRVTFIPEMDVVVVRMQPDNIYAQVMIAATGESVPTLSYYECLAHNLGKDIIMVNNPTDEHRPEANRESALIPYPFFQRYTLAAAAAAPQGMSRHWYGKNYDEDSRHMNLVAEINDLLRRLAPAVSPVAFVFSYAGSAHVWPRPWRETWRAYWTFARDMVEGQRMPFLTFFAETLRESLSRNPGTRVLVLHEYYPIPPAEVEFLRSWVKGEPGRHLVYIGGHDGYSWSDEVSFQQFRLQAPEMAELFGIDTEKSVELCYLDPVAKARHVSQGSAILGTGFEFSTSSCARVPFRVDAGVEILYRTVEQDVPVLARREFAGGGTAWFVGVALNGSRTRFPLGEFFRAMLRGDGTGHEVTVTDATQNVFFNFTRTGYFIAANCASEPGKLTLDRTVRAFDVRAGKMIPALKRIGLDAFSIRLFRIVPDESRVLDVANAIVLREIREEKNIVEITGMFHREITIVCTRRPTAVMGGCATLGFTVTTHGRMHRATVAGVPAGEAVLSVSFSPAD